MHLCVCVSWGGYVVYAPVCVLGGMYGICICACVLGVWYKHLNVCVCVCWMCSVCMCSCGCVYMCVYRYACGGQMWNCMSTSLPLCLLFWERVSHWPWRSLTQINCLASELQGPFYVLLLSSGVTNTHHHAWLLRGSWECALRSLCTIPAGPWPRTLYNLPRAEVEWTSVWL